MKQVEKTKEAQETSGRSSAIKPARSGSISGHLEMVAA